MLIGVVDSNPFIRFWRPDIQARIHYTNSVGVQWYGESYRLDHMFMVMLQTMRKLQSTSTLRVQLGYKVRDEFFVHWVYDDDIVLY